MEWSTELLWDNEVLEQRVFVVEDDVATSPLVLK